MVVQHHTTHQVLWLLASIEISLKTTNFKQGYADKRFQIVKFAGFAVSK